ncbi:hypothetical protein [Sphingomonas faeni]|uniref:hypothetical protein n=1 Tax=Sphingomonas faeni TaxID=185950 RepID=UPI0020C0A362|nr:hypothetical protein [Sphingomonas faeni]MCK8458707.1 hypothetical protein [Sphingomonas faeni]
MYKRQTDDNAAAVVSSVAEKVDQQGASSLIGQQKLPDYKLSLIHISEPTRHR